MSSSAIERLYHEEFGRILATVIRLVGDFDLAEEATQDAFAAALAQWPRDGVPTNPRAWVVSTARHKAIDRMRRHGRFIEKLNELGGVSEHEDSAIAGDAESAVPDESAPAGTFRVSRPSVERIEPPSGPISRTRS